MGRNLKGVASKLVATRYIGRPDPSPIMEGRSRENELYPSVVKWPVTELSGSITSARFRAQLVAFCSLQSTGRIQVDDNLAVTLS